MPISILGMVAVIVNLAILGLLVRYAYIVQSRERFQVFTARLFLKNEVVYRAVLSFYAAMLVSLIAVVFYSFNITGPLFILSLMGSHILIFISLFIAIVGSRPGAKL